MQASRGTAATAKKGFRRASEKLTELIRMANLVPRDSSRSIILNDDRWEKSRLPPTLPPDISVLPDAMRLELADHMSHPERWHLDLEKMLRQIRERVAKGNLPDPAKPDYSEKYLRQSFPTMEKATHYQRIWQAHENLERIVAVNESRLPWIQLVSEIGAFKEPDGTVTLSYDDFTEVIAEHDLEYIRRCPYEQCRLFFYAYRFQQPGCGPEHNDLLRKRRKAARDKKNKALKQKRASKARRRR